MTAKQRIIEVIQRLRDDVTVPEAIDHLYLLRKIEIGLQQADAGDTMSHEEFMKEIDVTR